MLFRSYIPPWQMQNAAEMKETVLGAAEKAGRADKIEFIGGIMGATTPYSAGEYVKIVEMAEKNGAKTCNIAFKRDSIVEDMEKFAKDVLSSYL